MKALNNYLENHEKQEFRNLVNIPLTKITGIVGYDNFKKLINDYDIGITAFYNEYSLKILSLVEENHEVMKYKLLSRYTLWGAIITMIIFPIVVSNYWLFLGLGLIPIAIMAMSIIKTPIYSISWIIILGLIIYTVSVSNFSILGIIFPFVALITGPRNAKILYRNTLVKSSIKNELCFKYLFYIGILILHEKETGEIIRIKENIY